MKERAASEFEEGSREGEVTAGIINEATERRNDNGRKRVVSQRSNETKREHVAAEDAGARKTLAAASFNFIRRGGNEHSLVYAPSKLKPGGQNAIYNASSLSSSATRQPTPPPFAMILNDFN